MMRPSKLPPGSAHIEKQARRTLACARAMLRPLLRVLLAAGVSERELALICTRLISKHSNTRGLARITPLVDRAPLEAIVYRWGNHFSYLERGKPARLRFRGKRPSFCDLVKSVSPHLSPILALSDLKRSRVVRTLKDGSTELISRFYPMRSARTVDIELVARMTTDFLRAQEFNLLKNPALGKGLFQRIAHNLNSDARLAPVFNQYAREQGQLFLETIDEWLVRHQPKRSSKRRKRKIRLGVGIYVINEAMR